MIIVSDTTAISNLLKIKRVELLHIMYGEVVVPPAVDLELKALKSKRPDVDLTQTKGWVKIITPTIILQPVNIEPKLDKGEIEAISLAKELHADWLLIDEKAGRIFAKQNGIKTIGLLGVLMEAKKKGHIPLVMPVIDDLVRVGGFWLNDSLYKEIKLLANE